MKLSLKNGLNGKCVKFSPEFCIGCKETNFFTILL